MSTRITPLTPAEKQGILARLDTGATQAVVAKEFNCSPTTVSRLWRSTLPAPAAPAPAVAGAVPYGVAERRDYVLTAYANNPGNV